MPKTYQFSLTAAAALLVLFTIITIPSVIKASEGIQNFYTRYDVKSSNNKIIHDNLLMVPAKNDFRTENFSLFSFSGVILASRGESKAGVEQKIKENAVKAVLTENGLKSVTTKDYDTVISYEGVIITPLNIIKNSYNEEQGAFTYEVQVEFSPIAFPDRWENLNRRHKIKAFFSDFLQFFK